MLRRTCTITALALALALALCAGGPASAKGAKRPRFYFEVRGVQVPAGSKPELKERAKGILIAELKKHPEAVLEIEPKPASGDVEQWLKARKLVGYALVLRVTKSASSLKPPAAGKVYRTLSADVAVAIDAEKIPSGQMALAGEGFAEVGTEVKKETEKERQQLLGEALADAVKQAVDKTIAKLGAPPGKSRRKKK